MRKPDWAVNGSLWENAQTDVRQKYGISSGDRFEELVEARYLVIGGSINRTAFIKSEEGTMQKAQIWVKPSSKKKRKGYWKTIQGTAKVPHEKEMRPRPDPEKKTNTVKDIPLWAMDRSKWMQAANVVVRAQQKDPKRFKGHEYAMAAYIYKRMGGRKANPPEGGKKRAAPPVAAEKVASMPEALVDVMTGEILVKAAQHFRSEEQRKFMWAKRPDIAEKWAHGERAGSGEGPVRKPPVRGPGVHSVEAGATSTTKTGRKKLRAEKKATEESERKAASFEGDRPHGGAGRHIQFVLRKAQAVAAPATPAPKKPPATSSNPAMPKMNGNGAVPKPGLPVQKPMPGFSPDGKHKAQIGEVRTWQSGEMKKVGENKWEPAAQNGKTPKAEQDGQESPKDGKEPEAQKPQATPEQKKNVAASVTRIASKVAGALLDKMKDIVQDRFLQNLMPPGKEGGSLAGEVKRATAGKKGEKEETPSMNLPEKKDEGTVTNEPKEEAAKEPTQEPPKEEGREEKEKQATEPPPEEKRKETESEKHVKEEPSPEEAKRKAGIEKKVRKHVQNLAARLYEKQ